MANNSKKVFSPSPLRRQIILENGILKEYCSARSKDFHLGYGSPNPNHWNFVNAIETQLGPNLGNFIESHGLEVYYECRLLYSSRRDRSRKAKGKIDLMAHKGKCYFVTLTFRDSAFEKSTLEQRRRWVRRWFKAQGSEYVANIDFGDEHGREHYHGVILCNEKPSLEWKHGFIKIIPVGNDESDSTKIGKYINKLTAHSLKASTGNAYRLIYSRKNKTLLLPPSE